MQIGGGIVLHHDPDVAVALNVLMHLGDPRDLAGNKDVLSVGVAPGV